MPVSVLYLILIILIILSVAIYYRYSEKINISENNFTFITIFDGTTMERAQELCSEKGMQLFEPRDATINQMVWDKAREKYPWVTGYWLNIKRSEEPMYGSCKVYFTNFS